MLSVKINGIPYEFPEGISILQALNSAGHPVPTLCFDQRLEPFGGCRLCAVQIEGMAKPVMACSTRLAGGMVIETHTTELEAQRRNLLRLLAQNYPRCSYENDPEHPFHWLIRKYELVDELSGFKDDGQIDELHPYIRVDLSRCIYCYRCVRICDEIQGQFVWNVWNRGDSTCLYPGTAGNVPRASRRPTLVESECVSCGACVDTCPAGALEDQSLRNGITPLHWTETTCAYCGTGCEINVGTAGDQIVTIRPVEGAAVSQGHLCVKGRYSYEFVNAKDRITRPMIRAAGGWKHVSWSKAVQYVAEKLARIVNDFGPDSVGVLGSARATNEENYITQKFARIVLGTNNVDCCARVCHAPTAAGMKRTLGTGAATNSFADIERAGCILVCGANPTENHPVLGARIKQAVRKGANLIVIDPRKIELTQFANLHLQIHPGTNIPLLNALAYVIVSENLIDESFVGHRVAGLNEFCKEVSVWTPERASEICGCSPDAIRQAARLYANSSPALIIHGLGVTEHTQGTDAVVSLVNLALLTGNLGKPGSGVNPLRGQNNVQGSAHMGCEPQHLAGYVPIEAGRTSFERVWQAPIPVTNGLNLMQMMDAAAAGNLKALWAIGYDIYLTNPFAEFTQKALKNLDLLIVQDLFLNETAREFGTVFLPACSSFEKDGTFMNAERRIQPVRRAILPPGDAKADWQIICDVAAAMGKQKFFAYQSAEEIWNEIRSVWEAGSGITYKRLERGGLQWPCFSEDHPGTTLLHQQQFTGGMIPELRCMPYRPTSERSDAEYPFLLVTGRTLYHFNAGTMTVRTRNNELQRTDYLDIHPNDARSKRFRDGQTVHVWTRYGDALLPIRFNDRIREGELFATFHDPKIFLNRLTGPNRDHCTATPEYKVIAARLEEVVSQPH